MTYFVAVMIIFSIFIVFVAYWLSFPKLLETKSNFRVLPTKPVHLVANRSLTVDAILHELKILDTKNRRSLTHLYISGNPGSGKSQLARLIGERYGIDSPENGSWFSGGTSVFVMTLNGRSLDDLLSSYVDFARRLDCNENILASIRDSNKTTTREKIDSLKTEISKTLRKNEDADKFLIIVDNVVRLSEISSFLPEMGNEDWQGGQVLLTTQDMSSVPANSSMTVHISVSQGMNPAESCQFLTDLSGVSEIPDLVNKVAKELDYQPLALASAAFYVKILRETKASAQFSWNDYLKKLSDGKRNLTEMKLSEINRPAYSLTMSTAVLLAIKMFAEKEIVLKHAFTFFSYVVSYKPLPLQAVVSYVLNIDNGNDEDDVSLRILQCSLVLHSDEKKNVSILVHRVVHDMNVLYNKPNIKENGKLGKPLKIFQSLLQEKCALGEIALIPHLKTFSAKTKDFSPKNLIWNSIALSSTHNQKMLKPIVDLTSAMIKHGEYSLSAKILNFALKIAKTRNKGKEVTNHQQLGEIFHTLGIAQLYLGNNVLARKYLKEAYEILSKQYGLSHEVVFNTLITLAYLHCKDTKQCNVIKEDFNLVTGLRDNSKSMAMYYNYLGLKDYNDGKLEQAFSHFLQARRNVLNERILESCNDRVRVAMVFAIITSNIGATYYRFKNYRMAKTFINQSIFLLEKITGPYNIDLGDSYYNLGLVHVKYNELSDAELCFKLALQIFSYSLDDSHEKVSVASQQLANVLGKAGKKDEAEILYKQYSICRCIG